MPFAPLFILYVAFRHVIFKFQHQRAIRKNVVRRQLQKSEYYWGILRTVEAGLESCGQLILQVWLLSSDFKKLNDKTFPQLADMTYNGVIFFLTFSYKPATEIEKSLGKLFMSVIALVLGVSGKRTTSLEYYKSAPCQQVTSCSLLPNSETRVREHHQPAVYLLFPLPPNFCPVVFHHPFLLCRQALYPCFAPYAAHSHISGAHP